MTTRRQFLGQSVAGMAFLADAVRAAAAGKTPHLLLRSSWQTVNIGDIAHTPGMLRLLADHLPEARITLWPSTLDDRVRSLLGRNFPKLTIAENREAILRAFDDCDFLLHGSGPSLVGQKQVASWKEKTGKPYGILGITLSSLDDQARTLFNNARFAYFRDTISLAYAKEQGLTCPVMAFGPDAAFGVSLRNDDLALAFLREHRLEEGRFLCAIPRLRHTPYWLIRGKAMTDLDRTKHATNEKMKEHDHAMVRDALVAFARQTSHKVLLCPEDESHVAVGKEMFLDKLPSDVKDRFVWRDRYWLTDEAVSVYVRSMGLLSMDMHSPIMAVGNGVPAIHCRFREQTSKGQMWRDIGLGDWLFDLDVEPDGRRITEAVLAIAHDPAATRAKVAKAMAFVNARQQEAMATLRSSLPS